jgi:hypothetical protein
MVSGVSPAAGQKTAGQIEHETLLSHISIFLVVGAVYNRDLWARNS